MPSSSPRTLRLARRFRSAPCPVGPPSRSRRWRSSPKRTATEPARAASGRTQPARVLSESQPRARPAAAIIPRLARGDPMSTSPDRTVIWIVVAVVLALVCCLCLVLVMTAASVYFSTTTLSGGPPALPPTTPPTPDVEDSSWSIEQVSPQAQAIHDELRSEVVPIADLIALAERLGGQAGIPTGLAETAAPIQIGTVQSFWGINGETVENFQVDAKLVYATDHVYFWVDQGVAYDLAEVKALVDDFETNTYPTDRAFFSS